MSDPSKSQKHVALGNCSGIAGPLIVDRRHMKPASGRCAAKMLLKHPVSPGAPNFRLRQKTWASFLLWPTISQVKTLQNIQIPRTALSRCGPINVLRGHPMGCPSPLHASASKATDFKDKLLIGGGSPSTTMHDLIFPRGTPIPAGNRPPTAAAAGPKPPEAPGRQAGSAEN
jgi:hypothetical protein